MRHNLETLGLRWDDGKPRPFRDGVVDARDEQKSKQQLCEREILATQMLQHHTRKLADQYQEQLQEAYAEMQRLSTKEGDKTINIH